MARLVHYTPEHETRGDREEAEPLVHASLLALSYYYLHLHLFVSGS